MTFRKRVYSFFVPFANLLSRYFDFLPLTGEGCRLKDGANSKQIPKLQVKVLGKFIYVLLERDFLNFCWKSVLHKSKLIRNFKFAELFAGHQYRHVTIKLAISSM